MRCCRCGVEVSDGATIFDEDRNPYCIPCYMELTPPIPCGCCSEEIASDAERVNTADGMVCSYCFEEHYQNCSVCDRLFHYEDMCGCGDCVHCCSCDESSTPDEDTPPVLISSLDKSAFILTDENVEAVLGILDKSKRLTATSVTGHYCTGKNEYLHLSKLITEIGKVKYPRYLYGVRSNEYDVILHQSSAVITDRLSELGLTYTIMDFDSRKVGLSFNVRKKKYTECVAFLEHLCTINY